MTSRCRSAVFVEEVADRIAGKIVGSKLRHLRPGERKAAEQRYKDTGQCDHNIVQDTFSWLYDARRCAICDKSLGAV